MHWSVRTPASAGLREQMTSHNERVASRAVAVPDVNGLVLLEATRVATEWLAAHREAINALNVFPVPDGDTGTNMLLTLREAVTAGEAAARTETSAGAIADAIASGAFIGARGNSGVILSQMIRGFATTIAGRTTIDARDIAAALAGARDRAYQAVLEPVEGTMLTVVRIAADEARRAVDDAGSNAPDLETVLMAALRGAREALSQTPELLDILRQANVVDAGGEGVVRLLEGLSRFAAGVTSAPSAAQTDVAPAASLGARMAFLDDITTSNQHDAYGYCVNFVVLANAPIDVEAARSVLGDVGRSVEVIGDERALRVHLHTENPGPALTYAISLGKLDRIQIDNMELQTERLRRERAAARVPATTDEVAVLAIAPGPGLATALRSMGAAGVTSGGQSMNPSTAELLAGINAIAADQVIVLPNNPNILLTAQQATTLTDKQVSVVPSRSVPQGLAALAARPSSGSMAETVAQMTRALAQVRTVEVTRANRDAVIDQVPVRKDDVIGLVDERLIATGPHLVDVAAEAVTAAGLDAAELVTIFTGAGVSPQTADGVRDAVLAVAPHLTVEVHDGGQPHYAFVVSVE